MQDAKIRIFQPFHDEVSRAFVDPGGIALDWKHNPMPKLRETAIYLHVQKHLDPSASAYLGVFSPKFAIKAGISLAQFLSFVEAHPGYDVYFINPFPHLAYLSFNVWDQGEISHPGIVDIAKRCFQAANVAPLAAFDTRNGQRSMAYCNFWVGTPRFFEYYTRCLNSLVAIEDTALQSSLFEDTSHDLATAPFFPFIVERMFSTIVATNNDFCYLNYSFSDQEIFDRSGEHRQVIQDNMPVIDGMDRTNSWTTGFRRKLIQDYARAERGSLETYAHLGLPFDLKTYQEKANTPRHNEPQ